MHVVCQGFGKVGQGWVKCRMLAMELGWLMAKVGQDLAKVGRDDQRETEWSKWNGVIEVGQGWLK